MSRKQSFTEIAWLHDFSGKWYDILERESSSKTQDYEVLEIRSTSDIGKKLSDLRDVARDIHSRLTSKFDSLRLEDTEFKFIQKAILSGTLSDKIAALVLAASQGMVFSISRFQQLQQLCVLKRKEDAHKAQDALKELLIESLLPKDRRLRFFNQQPTICDDTIRIKLRDHVIKHATGRLRKALENNTNMDRFLEVPQHMEPLKIHVTHRELVVFFFEDWLKSAFAAFVTLLTASASDSMKFAKAHAMETACAFLGSCPEQRMPLVALAINKLGDGDLAASTTKTLGEAISENSKDLKPIVVDTVFDYLKRQNLEAPSRHKVLLFISVLQLSTRSEDADVAKKLVSIYVQAFETALAALDDQRIKQKKRAAVNAKARREKTKVKDVSNLVVSADEEAWQSVLKVSLVGLRRALPYALNVSMRSGGKVLPIGEDTMNALYRASHVAPSASIKIEVLAMIFAILDSEGALSDRFFRALYDQLSDIEVFQSRSKNTIFKLVGQACKSDPSAVRSAAIIKRLLQTGLLLGEHPSSQVHVLTVVADVLLAQPSLRDLVSLSAKDLFDDAAGDIVHRRIGKYDGGGADDSEDDEETIEQKNIALNKGISVGYDSSKRDPKYARADQISLYELGIFAANVNPYVASLANRIIEGASLSSPSANSKYQAIDKTEGVSLLEAASKTGACSEADQSSLLDALTFKVRESDYSLPANTKLPSTINSLDFWRVIRRSNEGGIPLHLSALEVYFDDPFVKKQLELKSKKKSQSTLGEDGDDDEDDEEELADQFLDGVLEAELGGLDDGSDSDGDDVDMEELMRQDMEDNDEDSVSENSDGDSSEGAETDPESMDDSMDADSLMDEDNDSSTDEESLEEDMDIPMASDFASPAMNKKKDDKKKMKDSLAKKAAVAAMSSDEDDEDAFAAMDGIDMGSDTGDFDEDFDEDDNEDGGAFDGMSDDEGFEGGMPLEFDSAEESEGDASKSIESLKNAGKKKTSLSALASYEDYMAMIDADQKNADGYDDSMPDFFIQEAAKSSKPKKTALISKGGSKRKADRR